MGHEVVIEWGSAVAGVSGAAPCPLPPLLERLAHEELPAVVVMVDGALHAPMGPMPEDWRDIRLKTAAGTVTLTRKPGAIAIVVFANADDALKAAQVKIAGALKAMAPRSRSSPAS